MNALLERDEAIKTEIGKTTEALVYLKAALLRRYLGDRKEQCQFLGGSSFSSPYKMIQILNYIVSCL